MRSRLRKLRHLRTLTAHAREVRRQKPCPKKPCQICTRSRRDLIAPTSRCQHESTICRECFSKTVRMHVRELGNIEKIPCPLPMCFESLSHADVRQKADRQTFLEYDVLLTRRVLQRMPNFVWCKGAGCGSGQLHEGGQAEPVGKCDACGSRFCFSCAVPMHDGDTCKRFQQRAVEERRSMDHLSQYTKLCPRCGRRIEKSGGCDHMTCRISAGGCGYEFCWRCLCDYGPILAHGNHRHRETCQYYFAYDSAVPSDSSQDEVHDEPCQDEVHDEP